MVRFHLGAFVKRRTQQESVPGPLPLISVDGHNLLFSLRSAVHSYRTDGGGAGPLNLGGRRRDAPAL